MEPEILLDPQSRLLHADPFLLLLEQQVAQCHSGGYWDCGSFSDAVTSAWCLDLSFRGRGMPVSMDRLLGVFEPYEDTGDDLPVCVYFSGREPA